MADITSHIDKDCFHWARQEDLFISGVSRISFVNDGLDSSVKGTIWGRIKNMDPKRLNLCLFKYEVSCLDYWNQRVFSCLGPYVWYIPIWHFTADILHVTYEILHDANDMSKITYHRLHVTAYSWHLECHIISSTLCMMHHTVYLVHFKLRFTPFTICMLHYLFKKTMLYILNETLYIACCTLYIVRYKDNYKQISYI